MNQVAGSISVALASVFLFAPSTAPAQQSTNPQPAASSVSLAAAQHEARGMVPARALLLKALNADKEKPGDQFHAKLNDTIHLKNGTELPHGTLLTGVITTDKMQHQGTSSLALKFTEARLKDGKDVPIKATIISVAAPDYGSPDNYADQGTPSWNGSTVQVDEVDAEPGIDLHSRIVGSNSGVFVSNKKDNVKLAPQTILTLVIAPQQNQPETASRTGSGL